ncbi:MAG: hypothetical protein MUC76_10955 [Spirochaetes bacterium]|jgi:hypothetical protein|nr:hypothetical protein [Spirochaetota bacterium]
MKMKYAFLVLLGIVLAVSVLQMFSVPPYAGDVRALFRSGYFIELDKGFDIIKEAFIGTKMYGRPVSAWILLEDVGSRHGIDIRVYNASGLRVRAPGEAENGGDERVVRVLNSIEPAAYSEIIGGRYYSAVPVFMEDRCRFCHDSRQAKKLAGVLTFERDFDARVYYGAERVVIFAVISTALCLLIFLTLRWEPGRRVKELFDK